jgi:predicted  nucleic acid-binding Zn-ribbon protein
MDATVQALTDLSEVDRRLSTQRGSKARAAVALEGKRVALRDLIPERVLVLYDALGREGREPAIAPLVRGEYCGGCFVRVPPQLGSLVRRRISVCACPHCRRILYFVEPPAAPEPEGAKARTRQKKSANAVKARASAGSSRPR